MRAPTASCARCWHRVSTWIRTTSASCIGPDCTEVSPGGLPSLHRRSALTNPRPQNLGFFLAPWPGVPPEIRSTTLSRRAASGTKRNFSGTTARDRRRFPRHVTIIHAPPESGPRGPDPEPRQHRQGLRRPGAESARRGDRGARQGGLDPGNARGAQQPRVVQEVPGRSEPAHRGVEEPVRGDRELPAAEVGSELPRSAVAAGGYGESHHRGAQPLHPGGAGLQRDGAYLPDPYHRQGVRLPGEAELHRRQRAADLDRAAGELRHLNAWRTGHASAATFGTTAEAMI